MSRFISRTKDFLLPMSNYDLRGSEGGFCYDEKYVFHTEKNL